MPRPHSYLTQLMKETTKIKKMNEEEEKWEKVRKKVKKKNVEKKNVEKKKKVMKQRSK